MLRYMSYELIVYNPTFTHFDNSFSMRMNSALEKYSTSLDSLSNSHLSLTWSLKEYGPSQTLP